jgi:DNA-binding MarR family transcriptional regulator
MDNRNEIIRNVILTSVEATKSTGADLATLRVMLLSASLRLDLSEIEQHCDYLIRKGLLAERKGMASGKRMFVLTPEGREYLDSEGLI